jgi:hypothetical protein
VRDLDKVLKGEIGFFWPFAKKTDLNNDPMRGYVQLREGQWLTLDALDEDPIRPLGQDERESRAAPEAAAGSTAAAGVLLLNNQSHGSSVAIGGSKASTRHYRFRTILAGVHLDALRSPMTRGVSGSFNSGLTWAGMNAASESHQNSTDGRNRIAKLTIELNDQGQTVSAGVIDGLEVELKPTWSVSGPASRARSIQPY